MLTLLAGCVSQTALLDDPICEDEYIPVAAPDACRVIIKETLAAVRRPAHAGISFRNDGLVAGRTADTQHVFWDAWSPRGLESLPPELQITASSPSLLFVTGQPPMWRQYTLGIVRRGTQEVHWTPRRMRVYEARQHGDIVYALGQEHRDWVLLRIRSNLTVEEVLRLQQAVAGDNHRIILGGSVSLAVSKSGEPALAWQGRDGGILQLVVWRARVDAPIVVDTLVQAKGLAEASVYSNPRVTLTPHGDSGFAVAWRPFVDCGFDDLGGPSSFPKPESRVRAEVRWGIVRQGRAVMRRWATIAYPPGGGFATGPWPFTGLQILGTQIDGRAAFVWASHKGRLQAVMVDGSMPTPLGVARQSLKKSILTSGSGDITLLKSNGPVWPRYVLGMICDAPEAVSGESTPNRSMTGPIDVKARVP